MSLSRARSRAGLCSSSNIPGRLCLRVSALATSCAWNPCAPHTYRMNSLSPKSLPKSTFSRKLTPTILTPNCNSHCPASSLGPSSSRLLLYPDLLFFLHNSYHIQTYYGIYICITHLLFIVLQWNISSQMAGIFVLFTAIVQAPQMVLAGCSVNIWDDWINE